MDKALLQDIFNIPARSGQEGLMKTFIKNFLVKEHIPYTEDVKGNIYNISNSSPILSAHMDTVQDEDDAKLCIYTKIRENIISGYGVIGGDDKCGIFIIMQLLRSRNDFNFVFSVEEEVGGNGIKFFTKQKDLKHIPYGIVLDRRGSSDIVCYKNDYGTENFENTLANFGKTFGYEPSLGTFSDGDFLSEQISVANISVGYYNPHAKSEFVKINDLQNAIDYVWYVTKYVTAKFEKPEKAYSYHFDNDYENYGKYSNYDEDDYEKLYDCYECVGCKGTGDISIYLPSIDKYICEHCYDKLKEDIMNRDEKFSSLEELDMEIAKEMISI